METLHINQMPVIYTHFYCVESKQKLLLDALLKYSNADLTQIAEILDISKNKLKNVWEGESVLSEDGSKSLSRLFLLFFGNY